MTERSFAAQQRTDWHALPVAKVRDLLSSPLHGLADSDAAQRLQACGPNALPVRPGPGALLLFARQFKSPFVYLLLIAAAVAVALGESIDATFILAVLLVNAAIGTFQELHAESNARALEEVAEKRACARRDGAWRDLPAAELVPGDLVLVEQGERAPADVRLASTRELSVDEALLTGESLPVSKRPYELAESAALAERTCMLYAGTTVLTGRAEGMVVATGTGTEFGKIAGSLAAKASPQPPLMIQLNKFTRLFGGAIAALIAVIAAALLARGTMPVDAMTVCIALAVGAIPEGLPVAVTIALAIATRRMLRRSVIVRTLPAVEGLGACTLIGSDKTGTMTLNELTVRSLYLPPAHAGGSAVEADVSGVGYALAGSIEAAAPRNQAQELALSASLTGEASLARAGSEQPPRGDAVDAAFLVLAAKAGMDPYALGEQEPAERIGYDSARRYAAAFAAEADGSFAAHVKGAPETVLGMCANADREAVLAAAERLAERGLRVIAVAGGRIADFDADRLESNLQGLRLLGLAGIADPLRPEAAPAVARCRSAGVAVRMVTGDHPATALAIGRELGLAASPEDCASGSELAAAAERSEAELDRLVAAKKVFARIEPTQKSMIVESWQRQGEVVAVTGDGTNDAPALHAADIGVAMGRGGSEVARDASDLILADNNFASIVAGIEEGRIAYDNIRKLILLLVGTGLGEIVLFLIAIALGLPAPLLAAQLLWLNLVTNGLQDVALAFEGGEPDILQRPPRGLGEGFFNRRMLGLLATTALTMGCLAFAAFYAALAAGAGVEMARNITLLAMVLLENAHALNARSERRSALAVRLRANRFLIYAIVGAQLAHAGAMHMPGLSDALRASPLPLGVWAGAFAAAAVLMLAVEAHKAISRSKSARARASDASGA